MDVAKENAATQVPIAAPSMPRPDFINIIATAAFIAMQIITTMSNLP
jgi:hypothetical protein